MFPLTLPKTLPSGLLCTLLCTLVSSCSGSIFTSGSKPSPSNPPAPAPAPSDSRNIAPEDVTGDEVEIVELSAPREGESNLPVTVKASLKQLFMTLAPQKMKSWSQEGQVSDAELLNQLHLRILIKMLPKSQNEDAPDNSTVSFFISKNGQNISSTSNPKAAWSTTSMLVLKDEEEGAYRSVILNTDTQKHDTITESALGLSLRFKTINRQSALEKGVLIQYFKHSPDTTFKLDSTAQISVVIQ